MIREFPLILTCGKLLHGIGLEQLEVYWHGAIQSLELRWKKHVFKVKRDAIAHDLRTEGYTVRMTGKLSGLEDMKCELNEKFENLKKRGHLAPAPEALMEQDPRVRARLRLDLEEANRQYQEYGEWYESVFEPMVPIAQIDLPAPWSELRYQDNKKKIGETGKMPPAFLGFKDATQRYTISDGIHRINAAKDLGYKNIPAVVSYRRTYPPR